MNKLLARILLVLALLAPAIAYTPSHDGHAATPQQDMVLFSGKIVPVASADFTTLSALTLPSWVTFSRTGNAMQYDSTGKLTYGPNNLLTYSNTFSNAAWTPTGATASGQDLIETSATSAHQFAAASGVSSGSASTVIMWARIIPRSRTWVLLECGGTSGYAWYNLSGGGSVGTTGGAPKFTSIVSNGDGSYTVGLGLPGGSNLTPIIHSSTGDGVNSYTGTNALQAITITNSGISAVTYETTPRAQDQVITTSAAYYGPRFDYDPNTLAAKGLLIEESRTNSAKYAFDLSNAAWASSTTGGGAVTVTANGGASLDGTSTATKITFNRALASETALRYQTFTGTAASWTATFYVAAFGAGDIGKTIWVEGYNGTSVVGTSSIVLTSAYQPVTLTGTLAASASCNFGIGYNAGTGSQTGSFSVLVAAGQFEAGAFGTSPIQTAASSVTRAANSVSITGTAATAIAGSSGSLIVQLLDATSANPAAITNVVKGTNSILYHDTTGKVGTTNGTNILLSGAAPTWSAATRVGLAWSPSARSITYTGGSVASDANTPSNGGTLYLGSSGGSSAFENGWYQALSVYAQKLPNASLQSKMAVGGGL